MLLSVIALYNYDNNILNGIEPYLPIKPSDTTRAVDYYPINFDILKNQILLRAGEMSLVYSEPNIFKLGLATWAAKNRVLWQNLYDTIFYNYDPLFSKIRSYTLDRLTRDEKEGTKNTADNTTDNTDKTDNRTTNTTGNENGISNNSTNYGESGSKSSTENHTDTTTLAVQAFNDIGQNDWYNKEKTTVTGNSSGNENTAKNSNENGFTTNDDNYTQNIVDNLIGKINRAIVRKIDERLQETKNGTLKDIITETIKGQKPYQELIILQREIVEFNLYDYIVDDFVKTFCVMIY